MLENKDKPTHKKELCDGDLDSEKRSVEKQGKQDEMWFTLGKSEAEQ